jgi:hypothetical protein
MLAPYFEWLTFDVIAKYGPPAILVSLGFWLFWKTGTKAPQSVVPKDLELPIVAKPSSTIRDSIIHNGINGIGGNLPRASVTFSKSGKDAAICIDFSYFVASLGASIWKKRHRLLVREIASYRRDEEMIIPLVWKDLHENVNVWRWGESKRLYSSMVEGILHNHCHYRARVVFISADGTEEYIYFIVRTGNVQDEMPDIIGQHVFKFAAEWEQETAGPAAA